VLLVKHIGQPRSASIESDDYIPLSVDFVPVGSVRPVYYRAHGRGGGEMELKLEPLTGEIIGAVVIRSPAQRVEMPAAAHDPGKASKGSVFVDLGPWDLNPDLVPTRNVVSEEDEMSWSEDSDFLYYSWSPLQPETFAFTGNAGFGLTETNILTCIIVKK
jgi:hypothetical protein